ncbi:unnamed protein product, partial [Mycena citricolor]
MKAPGGSWVAEFAKVAGIESRNLVLRIAALTISWGAVVTVFPCAATEAVRRLVVASRTWARTSGDRERSSRWVRVIGASMDRSKTLEA